jgi:hypothetical protein
LPSFQSIKEFFRESYGRKVLAGKAEKRQQASFPAEFRPFNPT